MFDITALFKLGSELFGLLRDWRDPDKKRALLELAKTKYADAALRTAQRVFEEYQNIVCIQQAIIKTKDTKLIKRLKKELNSAQRRVKLYIKKFNIYLIKE